MPEIKKDADYKMPVSVAPPQCDTCSFGPSRGGTCEPENGKCPSRDVEIFARKEAEDWRNPQRRNKGFKNSRAKVIGDSLFEGEIIDEGISWPAQCFHLRSVRRPTG